MGYRPTAQGVVKRDGGYIRLHGGPTYSTPEGARAEADQLRAWADELEKFQAVLKLDEHLRQEHESQLSAVTKITWRRAKQLHDRIHEEEPA